MDNNIRKLIEDRCDYLMKLANRTSERLKSFPVGKVYVKRHKDYVYYYLSSDGQDVQEKAIDKSEKEYIGTLAQKGYLEKVLKAAETEMEVLKRFQGRYPKVVAEEVYEHLSADRQEFVKPIIPTDEQFVLRWQSQPFVPKPIAEGIPIYKTMRGEQVRSKSEQLIADRLYVNGIPYKYECPTLIGDEIFHPDFTVLRISDRKILYYEHCGRMDDEVYANDMVDRSRKYALAGIRQGDSLFYTFESSRYPLDSRVVDNLIRDQFK